MIYVAAILVIAGAALFVAAPLMKSNPANASRGADSDAAQRLEREHALALAGLRELEFDREMGKLSQADYTSLRATLERRALAAMSALEQVAASKASATAPHKRPLAVAARLRTMDVNKAAAPGNSRRPGSDRGAFKYCPQCGSAVVIDGAKFCGECGFDLAMAEFPAGAARVQR